MCFQKMLGKNYVIFIDNNFGDRHFNFFLFESDCSTTYMLQRSYYNNIHFIIT